MAIESTGNFANDPRKEEPCIFDKEAHRRNIQAAQDTLVDEFHVLIGDTERLLKYTQDTANAQTEELRNKLNENLCRAKSLLKEREDTVRNQYETTLLQTEEYIHAKPWKAVGIAAGVGFLIGLITRR